MMKKSVWLFFVVSALFPGAFTPLCAAAGGNIPGDELASERAARFNEAKFGMFIHWGLYAIPARGEWVMANERIEPQEYAKFAGQFNPVEFDAEAWVAIAKTAGMRYIVITAKHHDGFAMFDSQASSYNVVDATPYKRDPLKALAEACAEEGVGLGFYYSQCMDWFHPGGGTFLRRPQTASFDEYVDSIVLPQLKELLTGYGPVFSIWFDMPSPAGAKRAADMAALVRSRQADTIMNSRLLFGGAAINLLTSKELEELNALGVDYLTYADRQIPARAPWPSWETCMTLNESWGFNQGDQDWKSAEELVRQLIEVASRGGNFLLNVGPDARGVIPGESVRNLKAMGDWLKVNGESIYGTSASPLGKLPWGQCTAKTSPSGGTLYLHVLEWPTSSAVEGAVSLLVPGLRNPVRATLLSDGAALQTSAVDAGLRIQLPANAPDAMASVIRLELLEPLKLVGAFPGPGADGKLTLLPDAAEAGGHIQLERQGGRTHLGQWNLFLDTVSWTFEGLKHGKYRVVVEAAAGEPSEMVALCGSERLDVTLSPTGGETSFEELDLGELEIGGGRQTLTLVPVKRKFTPVKLRSLALLPVRERFDR